ncbi:MAG: DUF4142 domain-containing protein [Acidobacteriaceae bacterium]
MKQSFLKFLGITGLCAVLLLGTPAILGQTQAGSPLMNRSGSADGHGMSPKMQSNGPVAPQNNVQFIEQHVSDTIRENLAMEIELSELALKRSRSSNVKKFARQVIAENSPLAAEAKQLAPDKSGVFPNPMFEGTRQTVGTKAAEKKMNTMSGAQFNNRYLQQMYKYAQNDQQVGHSAYAMMDLSRVSPLGRRMWDMANKRVKRVEKLAKELKIKLD